MDPRSAYLHVPFCRHRCGYCNFTLVAGRDDLIDAYLDALERELSWLGQPHEVDTLFFGGGLPTRSPSPSSSPSPANRSSIGRPISTKPSRCCPITSPPTA